MSTSPLNPNDPDYLKIPAFQRKRVVQSRIQPQPHFTVGDAVRSVERDALSHDEPLSSSLDRARQAYQNSRGSEAISYAEPLREVTRPARSKPSARTTTVRSSVAQRTMLRQSPMTVSPVQMSFSSQGAPQQPQALRRYSEVGVVTAVLNKIQVVIIKLSTTLKAGQTLLFEVEGGMFEEVAESIQVDRKSVKSAKKGIEIGMKISQLPRNGSKVYRVA